MSEMFLLNASKEAVYIVLAVSAAPLLAGMIAGLCVSVLQTVTSLQEQTLGTVVKLAAVFAVLVLLAPWIGGTVLRFASAMMAAIQAPLH